MVDFKEVIQETQVQEQGEEGSPSSSIEDPSDSRNDEPTNSEEEELLRRAFEITVDEFIALTGEQPKLEHPGDNHLFQYGMLQVQFRDLWIFLPRSESSHYPVKTRQSI